MTMPSDKEHKQILDYFDGPITEKTKRVASMVRDDVLREILPFVQKVDEHDGFITKIKRNFLGIVKG